MLVEVAFVSQLEQERCLKDETMLTELTESVKATVLSAARKLTATVLHLLGVSPNLDLYDRAGRPHRACDGSPVWGLLS